MTGFPSAVRPPSGGPTIVTQTKKPLDQDRAAELFHQIVVPHLADGLALARWLAGNTTDAEDIVQEACVRALKAIGDYRGGSPKAWLLSIVRNTAFSWLARQRSSSLVMVGDMADVDDASVAASSSTNTDLQSTPESDLIRRTDQQVIIAAIATLALPTREVVVLRDVNGFSYKEIAEVLSLPIGTVMSRLSRGRHQLAAILKNAAL